MALRIDKREASRLVRDLAHEAEVGPIDEGWEAKVERLSRLCEDGASKTHIAFLGTAMLAKAMHAEADLFAIKPNHDRENPRAFSARTLCHGVLVPLSAELGVSIGVTGREPLNNQPYFRMTRLDDGTPVHPGGQAAFDFMRELVDTLQSTTPQEARAALRAFLVVRSRYQPRYTDRADVASMAPDDLWAAIQTLVAENAEGGRRAQAVVAGLMDAFAGPDRVESGRINDPSRRHPGDVCVRATDEAGAWEKAIEVRDKPVSAADVQIFGRKCVEMDVREVAVAMMAERQDRLDEAALHAWARSLGIGLTLFHGWASLVDQALYWAAEPKPVAAGRAVGFIHDRLVEVETSAEGVARWGELTRSIR